METPSSAVTIRGGVVCRVILEQLLGSTRSFSFDDVAVLILADAFTVVDAYGMSDSGAGHTPYILHVPFSRLTSLSHGNTKRGIRCDVDLSLRPVGTTAATATNVTSDLIDMPWATGGQRVVPCVLHIQFASPEDRSRVFSLMHAAWQHVSYNSGKGRRSAAAAAKSQAPRLADESNNQSQPPASLRTSTVTDATSSSSQPLTDVLQRVRSLQQRAGSLLESLRAMQNTNDSQREEEVTRSAFASLELELSDIKTRRAARSDSLRRAQQSIASECPFCKKSMPIDKIDSHPARCAWRPTTCADCSLEMVARDLEAHRGQCLGPASRRSSSVNSNASSTSSFATIQPSSPTTPMSLRQREKLRVQEVLRQQEQERRLTPTANNDGALSDSSKTPSANSAAASPAAASTGPKAPCPHCGKLLPLTHQNRCAQRMVECKYCREKMTARDALMHSKSCRERR